MSRISVALVDDHPVVLAGIKALLQRMPDIDLVGEATSGRAALQLIMTCRPDVAIIDISLPDLSGIDLARRVRAECPEVHLLALTVHEDRAYLQLLLQAGARGYILKRSAADDLVRAVTAVAAGGVYLDPAIADKALPVKNQGAKPLPPGGHDELSPREADVLKLTARGLSNKEIAASLDVSIKSIETYKARALEKIGVRTRAEIVRYAFDQGWLNRLED
jgi:DNA-binding NarL/FixJ family response regulator